MIDATTKLTLAAAIMEGLLASGNYTLPHAKGTVLRDMIRRGDAGEDWEKNAVRCRYPAYVVDDALVLLWELEKALEGELDKPVIDALTPKKAEPIVAPAPKKKKAARKKRKKC